MNVDCSRTYNVGTVESREKSETRERENVTTIACGFSIIDKVTVILAATAVAPAARCSSVLGSI